MADLHRSVLSALDEMQLGPLCPFGLIITREALRVLIEINFCDQRWRSAAPRDSHWLPNWPVADTANYSWPLSQSSRRDPPLTKVAEDVVAHPAVKALNVSPEAKSGIPKA
jgi:hypothetical protein